MTERTGATPNSIRRANRGEILRRILTNAENTRVDIANATHLTRTTLTNIVSEMTALGILAEGPSPEDGGNHLGRKSIALRLSENAPLICGLLILRTRICGILGTMDGRIVERRTRMVHPGIPMDELREIISSLFTEVMSLARQPVFAVSVVSLGPLDCKSGVIMKATNFYRENENFSILDCLRPLTDLPIYFAHDAAAAAMAEKLYGEARDCSTFLYLTLEGGIGAGFYLDGELYKGPDGLNGEIGHTSIRFDGELCPCGNRGCLELYASVPRMLQSAERYRVFRPDHPIFSMPMTIYDIIRQADGGDVLCLELLKEYCQYLSYALSNAITLLNIGEIIVGIPGDAANRTMEKTLFEVLTRHMSSFTQSVVRVRRSRFTLDAPLYGTIAIIMERVFQGELFPGELLADGE